MEHREPSRPLSKPYRPEEYVATGPKQIWNWDITYIRTPVRGRFSYPYIVLDVWNRKIVAWTIEAEDSADHAQALIAAACEREGALADLVSLLDGALPAPASAVASSSCHAPCSLAPRDVKCFRDPVALQ